MSVLRPLQDSRQTPGLIRQAREARARQVIERVFLFFVTFSNLYYFYRYAFQINSAGTSPTYTDTPLLLQVGKHLITLACLGVDIITLIILGRFEYRMKGLEARSFILVLLGYITLTSCISLFALAQGSRLECVVTFGMFFFVPMLLTMPIFIRDIEAALRLQWWMVFFGFGYHALSELVEIVLYLTIDRLPSLAYHNSLVRFGGGWDDPNGFASYLALIMVVFVATKWRSKFLYLIIMLFCGVMLAISVSFSGMFTTIISLTAYCFMRGKLFYLMIAFGLVALAGTTITPLRNWIEIQVTMKHDSAESRLTKNTFSTFLAEAPVRSALLGDHARKQDENDTRPNESSYLGMIMSFGVPVTLGFVALLIWTSVHGWIKFMACRRFGLLREEQAFAAWTAYVIGFTVSCNFVPNFVVYPVNLMFWVVVMLIWLTPIPDVQNLPIPQPIPPRNRVIPRL